MKFVVRAAPVAVVAFLAVSPAFADSPVAEKLFRDAQEAMKAEHYADACPKFAESNRLDPQLGTLLNLAACHEKEGKVASAWSDYMTLAELAGRAGDKGRADYAKKRIAAIEPTMPQLELKVPAGTTFTEVKLDQQSLGAAATMTTIPIDPGVHTLAFRTATQSWTQSVTIGATGKVVVEVKIPTATTTTTTTTKSPSLAAPQNGAELGASPSTAGGLLARTTWSRFQAPQNSHDGRSVARRRFRPGSLWTRYAQDGQANDLMNAFDFTQAPLPPLVLPERNCL